MGPTLFFILHYTDALLCAVKIIIMQMQLLLMLIESELEPNILLTPVLISKQFIFLTLPQENFAIGTAGKELYLSEFFCGLLQHLYTALE